MGIVSGFSVLTSQLLEVAVVAVMWQKLHSKVPLRLDGHEYRFAEQFHRDSSSQCLGG